MDPLLNIIKFIYKQKKSKLDIDSIDNFDEGVYFPQFISLIFNEKINNLKKNPERKADIILNFKTTLAFIKEKGIKVKNFYRLPNSEEKEKILLTVITEAYFKMSASDIFKQSKLILKSKDVKGNYKNVHKIFNSGFLLTLLSILSGGYIELSDASKTPDFNDVKESLDILDIPIAIDSDSFEEDNKYFLIQIQIIFAIYSDQIEEINKSITSRKRSLGKRIRRSINNSVVPLPLMEVEDNEEIFKTEENVLKKNYYNDNNAILNIVNSLIKDESQKVGCLVSLFTEKLDILFALVKDVTGIKDKITDYDKMLVMLGNHFPEYRDFFSNFTKTLKSQFIEFIKIITNCSYFTSEKIELLRKRCKGIFHEFQINFTDFDELYKSKGLLYLPLLQKVAFKKYSDIDFVSFPPEKELTLIELHEYFDQLNIPFVLDKNSFSRYQGLEKFVINYQTKLIIDQFDTAYLSKIELYNDADDEEFSPLLKTINMIGSRKGIHFHSPKSVVDGCLLPCFVECLLQKQLRNDLGICKFQQLTKAQSDKNIEIIIQYLKSQKDKFGVLLFDFNEMKSKSTKRLCKNLINLFFIKTSRKEILERCDSIVGVKCPIKSIDDFKKGKGFFALLHFMKHYNIGFNEKIKSSSYNQLKDLFKDVNVFMVLDKKSFEEPTNNEDTIFYQLQIIFDKLDNEIRKEKPGLAITEIFLKAANTLKKVNILKYQIFKISSEAKMKSQEDRKPRVFKHDEKEITNVQDKKMPTYNIDKLIKQKEEAERRMNCFDNVLNTGEDTLCYWNPFDDEYKEIFNIKLQNYLNYKDDLLSSYSTEKTYLDIPNYSKLLSGDLKNCFKNAETYKPKKNKAKTQGRLYKFYVYDKDKKKWVFNSNEFQLYVKDCNIGFNESTFSFIYTSLILVFNSNEEDLIEIKSNNFNDSASSIEDDQLFIYSLSYIHGDDYNKPTFLFLHVPKKNRENIDNLAYAITQIYIYLYAISDAQLLLLNTQSKPNNEKIHKQIEMIKIIDKIVKRLNIKVNNQSNLIFLANYSVPSYEKRFCDNLQKGEFAKKIKELEMKIIPFGFDSNDVFKEIINDITQGLLQSDDDLLIKLQNYPEYEISGLYLRIVTQPSDKHDDYLKSIINQREKYLNPTKTPDKNIYLLILDEFAFFTPQNDMEFNQKYRHIIYEILSQLPDKKAASESKLLKNELDTELKEFSKNMMRTLKDFIISELFWEDQQISILLNSYSMHLDKAFYCIIFTLGYGRIADIIYIENSDILSNQKKKDKDKIKKLFDNFNVKIIRRSEEKDLQNDLIKSTKYIMKETENLKDHEVIVNANQSLEDVIEQDF